MKIIQSSFEILDCSNLLSTIELAGRVCWKSEDKIEEGSAEKFIEQIKNFKHESVLEHGSITVRFICDRGVSHELVRHRIASYSQECVVGATQVKKGVTIKDLYDRQESGVRYDKTHNKTIRLTSIDESTGELIPNAVETVFYKGEQPVYKVTTQHGYTLTCTVEHRFLTASRTYVELKNLKIGDAVYLNGRPSLLPINDNMLVRLYLELEMSPQEIADEYNCPYRTVLRRLKALGVFESHKNDKNPEKYNKNHTPESYERMRETITKQYTDGRKVWNKGLTEFDHPGVAKQAAALRENHHDQGFGEENSRYKNGIGIYKTQCESITACEFCGSTENLEVHHLDNDRTNNQRDNLRKLCCACHNVLHHGWHVGKSAWLDKIISIEYVGIKETYDLEMRAPYNNYVADGFITHNSTRYCNYSKGKFGAEITVVEPATSLNSTLYNIWLAEMHRAEGAYFAMLDAGASPQIARSVLPNSLKTEVVMTANPREWRHVLKLRCDKAAHPDMRDLMLRVRDEFTERWPVLFGDLKERMVQPVGHDDSMYKLSA